MLNQPAFGGMLHQLVSLGAIEFRTEPLDALIERRLKHAWQHAPCPNYGDHAVQISENSPRIWCGNCRHAATYTLRTPFYNSDLTVAEVRPKEKDGRFFACSNSRFTSWASFLTWQSFLYF